MEAPQGRRRPREARFGKNLPVFGPVFCTSTAKNGVEPFEGPATGFEIRPVLASYVTAD